MKLYVVTRKTGTTIRTTPPRNPKVVFQTVKLHPKAIASLRKMLCE
jgi:hypothetical protein